MFNSVILVKSEEVETACSADRTSVKEGGRHKTLSDVPEAGCPCPHVLLHQGV